MTKGTKCYFLPLNNIGFFDILNWLKTKKQAICLLFKY